MPNIARSRTDPPAPTTGLGRSPDAGSRCTLPILGEPAMPTRSRSAGHRRARRRSDFCSRADAQGRRADRRDRHLPPGGAPVHRQADRAGDRTSPPRPSSPSRTRGCSTSCASAPTISESLEQQTATSEVLQVISARPASWSRCLRPCWRMPCASAKPSSALINCTTGTLPTRCGLITHRPPIAETRSEPHSVPPGNALSVASKRQSRSSHRRSSTRRPYPKAIRFVALPTSRRSHVSRRPDAQGERADRHYRDLPPGGAAVHR